MSGPGSLVFFLCLNDRGGAELSMIRLAQGLLESGRRVTLAVYGRQPELARELGFTGEIVDLKVERSWAALIPLYRLLGAGKYDGVFSALTHTNMIAALAACLTFRSIKVIATEHGLDGIDACARSRFFAGVVRLIYARVFAVVAVSQTLAQKWREVLPSRARVEVIYNPVAEERVGALPLPAHEWLSQKEIPVVVGVGRLKDEKNFALLIRAFARLREQKAARLIILGEGEQRGMLENLTRVLGIAGDVAMPGYVTDLKAWLGYAALFVSSSKREGFGNAIVEALACGVPVVATDCPYGPAEILAQGRYGHLVVVDDVEAMASAMTAQLAMPTDGEWLRRRAQDFTVARCLESYARLLDAPVAIKR